MPILNKHMLSESKVKESIACISTTTKLVRTLIIVMHWRINHHMPNLNLYSKLILDLIIKTSFDGRHKEGSGSIMLTQSSNNPTIVIWCNAVQYILFPIKSESVSWWLHKLMCLETNSSLTAATEEQLYISQSFVLME